MVGGSDAASGFMSSSCVVDQMWGPRVSDTGESLAFLPSIITHTALRQQRRAERVQQEATHAAHFRDYMPGQLLRFPPLSF